MIDNLKKPRDIPYRLTERGTKVFYDFKTFKYLLVRMSKLEQQDKL